jgi:flotillin
MDVIILILVVALALFVTFIAFARRYKRCPSDRILVVYGKVAKGRDGAGKSAACYHGGAAFIWPLLQDYAFLELTPMTIDIKLEGALSLQNIRVNTPSTFTVGISTEPGVMENAAERVLGLDMKQVAELARDIIFGQMRVVLATMPIEEINADRDKLIENIFSGVEGELRKVGLRLINVNIQDITDESGYIDALGKEAAARAINEARVKVAEQERDGSIGAANAERDQRIQVATAGATAVEGENEAKVTVAKSNALRREMEAEAERSAIAAEKVKSAQALEEAYKAEELSERQRAAREEATQHANIVVPAEIEKRRIETIAEAEAERTRRLKKGEADGLRSLMEAEAAGLEAVLSRKAIGFDKMVEAARGLPELAALLLVTEQLPKLVEEQVKAISNLKIDQVTVWEGGRGGNGAGNGKTATADFLSGLVGSLPPLHELTRNVGIELPEYLGRMRRHGEAAPDGGGGAAAGGGAADTGGEGRPARTVRPAGEAAGGGAATERRPREAGGRSGGGSGDEAADESKEPPPAAAEDTAAAAPTGAQPRKAAQAPAVRAESRRAARHEPVPEPGAPQPAAGAESGTPPEPPAPDSANARGRIRSLLAAAPAILEQMDRDRDGRIGRQDVEQAVDAAFTWARDAGSQANVWYYVAEGKPVGPTSWSKLERLGEGKPDLPVNLSGAPIWLPYAAVADAAGLLRRRPRG